ASFGGACPKLAVHTAFTRPREVMCERVINQEGQVFLTLCATAPGPRSLAGERPAHTATLLGILDAQATAVMAAQSGRGDKSGPTILMRDEAAGHGIVHAKQLGDVQTVPPIPIGPACRLCERNDCIARSAPPITRPLGLDDLVSGFGPYGLT
ncbi:MAG: short-chain fatty acyl-CoA regulator family protein, partial [Pseudomonadota bacterium]